MYGTIQVSVRVQEFIWVYTLTHSMLDTCVCMCVYLQCVQMTLDASSVQVPSGCIIYMYICLCLVCIKENNCVYVLFCQEFDASILVTTPSVPYKGD